MGSRNLTDAAPSLRRGGSDSTVARTCRATGEALLVPARNRRSRVDRITGSTGKSIEGERVTDGFVVALMRVTPVERRNPAVCKVSDHKEGKDEMTKASIDLQDLRRRIYVKAKAETSWKFWGLYIHVCKLETLCEAYALAKKNDGASGSDGVTFEGYRSARRRGFPRADRGRTGRALLCAIAGAEAGNPEGWRQVPRPFDSCDPRPGGAGCAQAHIGTDLRGGLPIGGHSDTDRNGHLMKRWTVWRERSFSIRRASSTSTFAAIWIPLHTALRVIKCGRRGWVGPLSL